MKLLVKYSCIMHQIHGDQNVMTIYIKDDL